MTTKIKQNLSFYIFLAILFVFVYFLIKNFIYIDLVNGCIIDTHTDIANNQRKEIFSALKYLKKYDKNNYKMVCENVDDIYDGGCYHMVFHYTKNIEGVDEWIPDCYVKGTRAIYADIYRGRYSAKELAGVIIKNAEFSKQFWKK